MPPKQRQIKIEQRGGLAAMQEMESRSDEELERETKHRAAAMAILGARAADRYDAKVARAYFQKALAACRPQERMQLRRMAQASIALAERRPDELKESLQRLGQAPPSRRQLLILRLMGLLAPPPGSSILVRIRGYLTVLLLVVTLLGLGLGVAELVALPFGGVSIPAGLLIGLLVVTAALGVLTLIGRRRQRRAREQAAAAR